MNFICFHFIAFFLSFSILSMTCYYISNHTGVLKLVIGDHLPAVICEAVYIHAGSKKDLSALQ